MKFFYRTEFQKSYRTEYQHIFFFIFYFLVWWGAFFFSWFFFTIRGILLRVDFYPLGNGRAAGAGYFFTRHLPLLVCFLQGAGKFLLIFVGKFNWDISFPPLLFRGGRGIWARVDIFPLENGRFSWGAGVGEFFTPHLPLLTIFFKN